MSNLRWHSLSSSPKFIMLMGASRALGYVCDMPTLQEDKWIAQSYVSEARAEFDTMEEAQQFLTVVVSANE